MKKITLLLNIFIVYSNIVFSQILSGEIRQRGEYRNGYKTLPDSNSTFASFVSQRSRLGAAFKLKNIEMKITFQDVRTWGSQKLKTTEASTGVYEAWTMIPITDSIYIKLGRQEIIYNNQRILSNNNWNQNGQVHDAAMLKYQYKGLKINLCLAFNADKENLYGNDYSASFENDKLSGNYKSLNFISAEKEIKNKVKISIISIAEGFQKENTTNTNYIRVTSGGNISYKPNNYITGEMHCYWQGGKTRQGTNINALYINPNLYLYLHNNKININPGSEIFSGNDTRKNNNTYKVFSTLYGTGHSFNGHIDYFTDIPKNTKNAGLIDIYVKNSIKISDKSAIAIDYHYFQLQNIYVHKETNGSATIFNKSYLGSEIDLNYNINIFKELSLLLGYSTFIPEEPLNYLIGGTINKISHWGFIMLTFKPTFNISK